ncbi:MAG: hypothetical protein JRI25_07755 [Deltaproteobacteria bacterium]|nr:hypothetical protein [Deltaproteobacteria bacterium]
MRHLLPSMLVLVVLGCPSPAPDDSGAQDTDTHESEVDVDEDGVAADEDCDDYDPDAYPGNTESWDGRDNDCDGWVDGRGDFAGDHAVSTTAVYEGEDVPFLLDCPTEFARNPGTLSFSVRCEPDQEDADAMLLLGEVLTLTPIDNGVSGQEWVGEVLFQSTNGWSATGSGAASWVGMDQVVLTTVLDTVSLDWSGSGLLSRVE